MNKSMNEVTAWLKALVHEGAHLRLDSRSVRPGDVFVAVPGLRADGAPLSVWPLRAAQRAC